jgi:signal transduction histidine kinase
MAVAGPDGVVVRSDIVDIPIGSSLADSLIEASRRLDKNKILAFGVAPPMPRGYMAVVSMPHSDFLPIWLRNDIIKVSLLVLAAILAFAAAMCVLIVRSITGSVLSLEAATKRVAAGELDLPISVEGSNEFASLSRSLDILRIEIKEDQARRARFIMGISHDLKTPLALVKGYAEALEVELGADSDPNARAHLGIIQSKADQLEGMIDDLIDFERVDTGEWSRGLVDLDLGCFLRAFAKRVEADAILLERNVLSAIDLPEGSIVRMDERLATRALENLVNNALRYTSAGDDIRISARAEGEGSYVLSVADEGPGIPSEDLAHIFEPFYRGSSSRREEGMGLGLSIVKTIVESHGWTIDVRPGGDESCAQKGVAFVIAIPRSE